MATVNISPQANAGTDGSVPVCDNSVAIIDLFSLITGEQAGGTWTRLTGTGGTFNNGSGTFIPAPGATTSTFQYEITGASPCPNDQSVATVNISPQANAGTDGSVPVCDNSIVAIDLFSLITGEQLGGVWTRLTGTGGTFVAATGTYTPAPGATTSTFQYEITGTPPCPNDQSVATVNISPQANAGSDGNAGSAPVCDNSVVAIDLFSLITGEQSGGSWTRLTGTGGTFVAATGTFTPVPGATNSTFQYEVTGISPCPNDQSVATVNISPQANAGVGSSTLVCVAVVDLYSLLTGEQTGGTWTRLTGTGGIFNAGAGTFTTDVSTTTSTFRYTVTGITPCPNDEEDITVNLACLSVGSTVFADPNNNGVQDTGNPLEDGIAGVTVQLYYDADNNGSAETQLATTLTDANGDYYFGELLPGNYQVLIPTPDASAQTSSSGQDAGDANDGNDNGAQSGTGAPTSSAVFALTPGLEPGTAAETFQGGAQDDSNETNGNMTIDFGFVPTMSLGSTVFADVNNDGVQNPTNPLEDGIPGVTVNLYYDHDNTPVTPTVLVATTTTDPNGNYYFPNLPEGDYQVGITPPGSAAVSSTGTSGDNGVDGNDNGDQPGGPGTPILSTVITLNGGTETANEPNQGGTQDDGNDPNGDMTIDFGLVPNMSIGSTVFYDMNNDGAQNLANPQETGIQGVVLNLLYDANNDGVITAAELNPVATATTDALRQLLLPEPASRQLPGGDPNHPERGPGLLDGEQPGQPDRRRR